MSNSLVAYNNAFLDPRGAAVDYTDVGGTFSNVQPLSNLSKPQLGAFAEFVGATCEFDADAGAAFEADVFALLGHTLEDGMEVEFIDESGSPSSLGTVTVQNYRGLPQHAILILDAPVSLQTLTVSVTGGTALQDYTIGALWASPSFREEILSAGYDYSMENLSIQSWALNSGYAANRPTYESPRFEWPLLSEEAARGPAWPNARAILREIGGHSEVICIPSIADPTSCTYGLITQPIGPVCHAGNKNIWRAGATIREQGS